MHHAHGHTLRELLALAESAAAVARRLGPHALLPPLVPEPLK